MRYFFYADRSWICAARAPGSFVPTIARARGRQTTPRRAHERREGGEGPENLQPSIFSQVIGASMDGPNGGVMYELPDNGQVSAEEVLRFRI